MNTITSSNQYGLNARPELNSIDINEQYERRAWSRSLGISEERLIEVVRALGPSADRVRAYLRSRSDA
jgi:hypothetical protein